MKVRDLEKRLKSKNNNLKIPKFINKILFIIVLFLVTILFLKNNQEFKQLFYEKVYKDNINFASINNLYQKYFGNIIPYNIFTSKLETVFNENLEYKNKHIYLDGVKLEVDDNYLVPSIDNGIVIFVGKKDGYNNTVIIECENGVEVWYGNIDNENVKIYDYVYKGSLIGEASNALYMVFMKDGEILNYEDHI